MRTIYISNVLLLVAISLSSCQMRNFKGYDKYQTFNEFELKGVNSPKLQSPFIFLKRESDTIFVVKSNKKDETIKYINMGKYWYTSMRTEEKPTFEERSLGAKLKIERLPQICEKFIFNDTIVEYVYLLQDETQRLSQEIYVKTKDSILNLVIQDDDIKNINNPYNEIINFVRAYKKLFPYNDNQTYQPRFYYLFEKQIIGDTLYLSETKEIDKKKQYSIKLNSMGEFDLPPGVK